MGGSTKSSISAGACRQNITNVFGFLALEPELAPIIVSVCVPAPAVAVQLSAWRTPPPPPVSSPFRRSCLSSSAPSSPVDGGGENGDINSHKPANGRKPQARGYFLCTSSSPPWPHPSQSGARGGRGQDSNAVRTRREKFLFNPQKKCKTPWEILHPGKMCRIRTV